MLKPKVIVICFLLVVLLGLCGGAALISLPGRGDTVVLGMQNNSTSAHSVPEIPLATEALTSPARNTVSTDGFKTSTQKRLSHILHLRRVQAKNGMVELETIHADLNPQPIPPGRTFSQTFSGESGTGKTAS